MIGMVNRHAAKLAESDLLSHRTGRRQPEARGSRWAGSSSGRKGRGDDRGEGQLKGDIEDDRGRRDQQEQSRRPEARGQDAGRFTTVAPRTIEVMIAERTVATASPVTNA